MGVAQQAVQVHDHAQLGPDPTRLGQPTGLQGPAGQLRQGISVALAATAGVTGVGRAGQRLQGGQQALAGLGLQQPIHGHHALKGRGQPQAPPLVTPLPLPIRAVRVGDLEQAAQEPPQPTRVQLPGCLDQDWFGLAGEVVGEGVGAVGQDLGVGD
jgi:hypothetical protein